MDVPLAILWHQHQPYYKEPASGELAMPWVRLHGIKDYYGMARLLADYPGARCVINLVPAMVDQLLDYVERGATDAFLRRAEIPAADLQFEDAKFILDHFFMATWDRMIRLHPRYRELLELRRLSSGRPAARAAEDFSDRDFLDLQVWFNLAWFHPLCEDEWPMLRELRAKGRDFSEADKTAMLKVQREVLARVLPLHKELAARGQVELTATPYYHPILPLLCDMESLRVAIPKAPLPSGHGRLTEDAELQVAKALAFHRRQFGAPPEGMWPAEGSVSPEAVSLFAKYGVKWIATDEELLSASLNLNLRGGFGRIEHPELLYRPWRAGAPGAETAILFRDHQLSDLIGFQYMHWDGEAAAQDFLTRVSAAAQPPPAGPETLVLVALDGENCWEHYPEQGVKFLRALYSRLQERHKGVTPVRVCDFLREHPPSRRVERLFAGSWINHNFYIWAGHAEDRKAWEYLYRVRRDLAAETARRGATPPAPEEALRDPPIAPKDPALARAWEELYIAEGSDWFWWYGDDHTSGNDDAFDLLFRTHLKGVYQALELPAPYFLDDSVRSGRAAHFTRPSGLLSHVVLDGRVTSYFEWLGAGLYLTARDGGAMSAGGAPLVSRVVFGSDLQALCARVDPQEEPRAAARPSGRFPPQSGGTRVLAASGNPRRLVQAALLFIEPPGLVVRAERGPPNSAALEGARDGAPSCELVWDEVLELRIPLAILEPAAGKEISFFVETVAADGTRERYPRAGALSLPARQAEAAETDWIA